LLAGGPRLAIAKLNIAGSAEREFTKYHPYKYRLESPPIEVNLAQHQQHRVEMIAEKQSLEFRFKGLEGPEILDASELIKLLSAANRLSMLASRSLYGASRDYRLHITHVRSGSIEIGGLVDVLAAAQSAFPSLPSLVLGLTSVGELLRSWLDLLVFLKGQEPKKIQRINNGNDVSIENNSGNIEIFNGNIYNTFILSDAGKDAEKLTIPIRHGATSLEVRDSSGRTSQYSRDNMKYFQPIKSETGVLESEIDAILDVRAPVLEGEGLWRFRYGRTNLTAKLADADFQQKIDAGEERFGHGDKLRVRLRTTQNVKNGRNVVNHCVTKVVGRL
jgi:hypothetical protein